MTLESRIARALSRQIDPAISEIAAQLGEEAGALAVLFYGSNLRTGSLDGVLDFYVLLPGEAEKGIWPTVSYREWDRLEATLRAKIAAMTYAKFVEACAGKTRDSTIWARFVQPSALAWSRDGFDVSPALMDAARTAAQLAVALGPDRGTEADFWGALFRATYQAELRVEPPGRENSILELNREHFDGLLPAALESAGVPYESAGETLTPRMPDVMRREVLQSWGRARRWGKAFNIARLVRATRTFDGAARYAAWKVERHTGVQVEVTPWRERHPILAAPGVLWKVWRAKRQAGQR